MKRTKYRSFIELKELLRSSKELLPAFPGKPAPVPVRVSASISDDELFEQSMQDVTPLGWSSITSSQSLPIEIPNPQENENEGLKLLTDFVKGRLPIDFLVSGEYVEGAPDPRGKRWIGSLRMGHFAVQAHLDLHGLGILEARNQFEKFIRDCLWRAYGCVRIVHGRGQHSDGHPLLKAHLQRWLCSRRMSRHIVAYTSARLSDGGGGALYVLLKRKKA